MGGGDQLSSAFFSFPFLSFSLPTAISPSFFHSRCSAPSTLSPSPWLKPSTSIHQSSQRVRFFPLSPLSSTTRAHQALLPFPFLSPFYSLRRNLPSSKLAKQTPWLERCASPVPRSRGRRRGSQGKPTRERAHNVRLNLLLPPQSASSSPPPSKLTDSLASYRASQEERIDMLRAALASKIGVRADNSHYAPLPSLGPSASITTPSSRPPPTTTTTPSFSNPPPPPPTSSAPPNSPPGLPRPSSLGPPPGLPPLSSTNASTTPGRGNGSLAEEEDDGVYL